MIRRFGIYILPVFLAVFFIFQPGPSAGEEQMASKPITLKVVIFPFLSSGHILIAEEEGYFAEQGLQIEYIRMKEDVAIQALARGQVDVWGGLISIGAMNAIHRGANIRFVADKGFFASDGCPFFGVVARKALVDTGELNGPAQLKGRNVSWLRASFEEYFLEMILQKGGLKLDDVQKITIPPPADLGAMAKGSLDLTVTAEPWVSRLSQSGHGVLWMQVQKMVPGFQFGLMLYGPNILEKNPDAGRRFMTAYLKGVRQFNKGKTARNLEILAKQTRLDKDLLVKACWHQVRNDGSISAQSISDFQDWAVAKGFQDSKMEIEELWEPSFVEHAKQVLGSGQ